MTQRVDDIEAVELYDKQGWSVGKIALHFDVTPPTIYRAFHRQGYETEGMKTAVRFRGRVISRRFVPRRAISDIGEEATLMIEREPCFKCGVRADIGCRHLRTWE